MTYRFFLRFLTPRWATVATTLTYYLTMLAIVVVVSLPTTQVAFRYLGL